MRGALRNKERWKGRRTPTQDPSTHIYSHRRQAQHALQKKILAQTRALGIVGVLPAFQGNMPPQIKALMPRANISTTPVPPRHPFASRSYRRALLTPQLSPGSHSIAAVRALKSGLLVTAGGKRA